MSGHFGAAGHHSPIPVAVLDLHKLVKLFHNAAFWLARAQNTHVLMRSAFAEETLGDRLRVGAAKFFTMGQYEPVAAELTVDQSVVVREADRMAALMVTEYLERLASRGPVAADAYARTVYAKQSLAERQVLEIWNQQHEQNQMTAEFAGKVARGLNDTIVVCEVLLAVGSLAIGLGGAAIPAVLSGGMSAEAMAGASFAIGQGYNFLSKAVTVNSVGEIKAVAIDMVQDGGTSFGTDRLGKASERKKAAAEKAETIAETAHKAAKTKVGELNKRLATKMSFMPRQAAKLDRWATTRQMEHAASDVKSAQSASRVGNAGTKVFPLIQFGLDIRSAFMGGKSRLDSLGPN